MLRYALIYGGITGGIVITIMSLVLVTMGTESILSSQAVGYAIMLVVLSLVFIGIKRYRDVEHGGVVTFAQAAGVGVAIAAVAGVIYAIGWEVSLVATDYAFIDAYRESVIADIKAQGLAASEEAAKIAEINSSMESYRNPLFRLPITFVEIFPVGLIVALISAFILKNAKVLPARAAA